VNFSFKMQALSLVLLLFGVIGIFLNSSKKASSTSIHLGEWISLIEKTSPNHKMGENKPSRASIIGSSKKEVKEKFESLLLQVKMQMTLELEKKELWHFHKNGIQWKKDAPYFQPYALKLEFQKDAKIFFFGDLHGDIRTLSKFLEELKNKNILNDDFKLKDEEVYLCFLGDFTDRGNYGLEVLYTLLTLKQKNKNQVILGRGNHEDLRVYQHQGFLKELKTKLSSLDANEMSSQIMKFYEILPVVTYIGRGGEFLQACHGGLEPQYTAREFLASKEKKFDLISPFVLSEEKVIEKGWLYPQDRSYTNKFFGFMWSDFQFKKKAKSSFGRDGRYAYSRDETIRTLKKDNIRAVVRAHQHKRNSRVMKKLFTHGLFRFWQKDDQKTLELPVEESSVFMLNMGVDNKRWGKKNLKEATYGELLLKENPPDWRIFIHKVKVFDL
jgi:hypothetical protein